MVSGIATWPAELFANQFKARCVSEDGRRLASLIEQNVAAMVLATELHRPALAPLLPLIPDDLAARLQDDNPLMQTLGYLAALEMNVLGYRWEKGRSMRTRWPFSDKTSSLAIMTREPREPVIEPN